VGSGKKIRNNGNSKEFWETWELEIIIVKSGIILGFPKFREILGYQSGNNCGIISESPEFWEFWDT